jgi:uncharacterized membrane protein HdeD (DUF308 family)
MLLQFKAGLIPAALQLKALATAVGIVFLAEGVVMAVVSLSNRSTAGWAWGLVNGLVSLVLGLLILSMGPAGLLHAAGGRAAGGHRRQPDGSSPRLRDHKA